jgi:hydroxyacylglutathione hydrolase
MNLEARNKPQSTCRVSHPMIKVHTLPAFNDNYLWLFHLEGSSDAYVVDPGDANVVIEALRDLSLDLSGILITHHHGDHTGGIGALLEHKAVPVFGPDSANIPQITQTFRQGEILELAPNLKFDVLEVPGHTLDHIAWFCNTQALSHPQAPLLFCGDTLFAGGCGRLFEGSPSQMLNSLSKLAALPSDTAVHCAHEYTLANLAFAQVADPENKALKARSEEAKALRQAGKPTVPSALSQELNTNPFLRCARPELLRSARNFKASTGDQAAEVFASIREWKDSF